MPSTQLTYFQALVCIGCHAATSQYIELPIWRSQHHSMSLEITSRDVYKQWTTKGEDHKIRIDTGVLTRMRCFVTSHKHNILYNNSIPHLYLGTTRSKLPLISLKTLVDFYAANNVPCSYNLLVDWVHNTSDLTISCLQLFLVLYSHNMIIMWNCKLSRLSAPQHTTTLNATTNIWFRHVS